MPMGLLDANETAFVGHGGKYWLALYYTQVKYINLVIHNLTLILS